MIFVLCFTAKQWFARFVTRRLWVEAAAWMTAASALKGWRLEWKVVGFRWTTPLLGTSIVVNWRGSDEETANEES